MTAGSGASSQASSSLAKAFAAELKARVSPAALLLSASAQHLLLTPTFCHSSQHTACNHTCLLSCLKCRCRSTAA